MLIIFHKKINGDLGKVSSVDSNFIVKQTGNFIPQGSIQNIGKDYGFINAAMTLDLNKVSEPIKGLRGYYLIKVTKRTAFDNDVYSTQSTALRNSMLQEKRSQFLNQWISEIKKSAEIKDNRHLFFGQ